MIWGIHCKFVNDMKNVGPNILGKYAHWSKKIASSKVSSKVSGKTGKKDLLRSTESKKIYWHICL